MSRIRMLVTAGLACLTLAFTASPAIAEGDRAAGSAEKTMLERVTTPQLAWEPCGEALCAKAKLPLNYSKPNGKKIEAAVKKIPATDGRGSSGTLFVNPGGPGAAATHWVTDRLELFPEEVRQKFDIIGFDPRGTNESTRLQCFNSEHKQDKVYETLTDGFPVSEHEEKEYSKAAHDLALACADEPLARHMSTTDVARDMEMIRRAVGDERLTFLGFSYGSYLGQVYAAMFPDHVRAMVLDGVVDADAWRGTRQSANTPMPMRMGNALGASQALTELLARCVEAGPSCSLADPKSDLEFVMEYLREQPLQIMEDGETHEATYANLVGELLYSLYSSDPEAAINVIAGAKQLIDDSVGSQVYRNPTPSDTLPFSGRKKFLKNDLELNAAVVCSDSYHPNSSRRWAQLADRADEEAPYFGRQALWSSIACADWTANDVDAFAGSFSVDSPILVVGARWDPATSYAAARHVSDRLPNSTLVTSNNWGHTTYGESACADDVINDYLISAVQPSADVTCTDGAQPFEGITSAPPAS